MNIDDLKKVVADVCQVLNAVSKFVAKQGIGSLFGAIGPLQDLAIVNWGLAKSELLALDNIGRDELNAVMKSNLQLVDAAAQAKLLAGVDCIEQAVNLVEEGVSLFNQGKGLVDRVKQIVGA